MARELVTELDEAIAEPVVRPFLALRIELPDPVYVWTGLGTLIFNDADDVEREWLGAGGVGAVDTIGEATDGSATGIKASLYNVPAEFRDDLADQATKGALFEVYIGALNETFQTVDAVQLLWKGKSDTYEIVDGGDTLSVQVTGESRMRDQGRPAIKKFTDEYQQRQHSGDKFFQFVSQMAEISILWSQTNQTGVGGYAQTPLATVFGTSFYR